ncbi:hypothetical protein CRUP_015137, partial [Coryphaenoides rupestris]
ALARSHRCGNRARLCHVTRNPVQGLGITIRHVEGHKGQFFLRTVTAGPAERAGVCYGDKLIWINGVAVANLTFSALNKMSASSCIKHRVPVVPDLAECLGLAHRPRTLRLEQGPDGYGFLLRQERLATQRKGIDELNIKDYVAPGGSGQRAGLQGWEAIVEVDGQNVKDRSLEEVGALIKGGSSPLRLLVASAMELRKNGIQQKMKAPTTMPRVLAALCSERLICPPAPLPLDAPP